MSDRAADDVLVVSVADPDGDLERADELARMLREELLDAGAPAIEEHRGGAVPEGTRGLDAVTVGTLLVSISTSGFSLIQAVAVIRGWARRAGPARVVTVQLGDRQVTVSGFEGSDTGVAAQILAVLQPGTAG